MRTLDECLRLLQEPRRKNWRLLNSDERRMVLRHAIETHFPEAAEFGISCVRWQHERPPWAPTCSSIVKMYGQWSAFTEEMGLPRTRDAFHPQNYMPDASATRASPCQCGRPSTHWPIVQILGGGGGRVLVKLALCEDCYRLHLETEQEMQIHGLRSRDGNCQHREPVRAGAQGRPGDRGVR